MAPNDARRDLLRLVGAIAAVAIAAPACRKQRDGADLLAHTPRNRHSDRFPDVVLHDQNGDRYRFYSDLVKDRIVIINFMYIGCTGI